MKAIVKHISVIILILGSLYSFSQNNLTIEKANKLYNEGLYDSSLVLYNSILDQNLQSAELYFNIGNAFFKNNNLPKAILYYEKALKLSPNDEDIKYNLSISNSMIVDKIENVPQLFYKQWWNYFYNRYSTNTWAIISIVIWILFLVSLGVFLLSSSRSKKKFVFYLSVLIFISALISFGLASQKYYINKENKEAIIFTPTITVKSSPTKNSVDLFVVHEGTKVKIIDRLDNWNKVKIKDGSIGWLPSNSMELI